MATAYQSTYRVPSIKRRVWAITDDIDCVPASARYCGTIEINGDLVAYAQRVSINRRDLIIEANTRHEYALFVAGEQVPNDYTELE